MYNLRGFYLNFELTRSPLKDQMGLFMYLKNVDSDLFSYFGM